MRGSFPRLTLTKNDTNGAWANERAPAEPPNNTLWPHTASSREGSVDKGPSGVLHVPARVPLILHKYLKYRCPEFSIADLAHALGEAENFPWLCC